MSELTEIKEDIKETKAKLKQAEDEKDREMIILLNARLTEQTAVWKNLLAGQASTSQPSSAPTGGIKRRLDAEEDDHRPGLLNRIVRFFWTSTTATTYGYYRVTGAIEDSRTSKGYRSTIYKCAQDHMAYYCEDGNKQSIFYDGASRDMKINLLFEHKAEAFAFQNTLVNFRFVHPTFGNKIRIDETVNEVHLPQSSKRVFHHHYAGADNNESPALSLADIRHVLSSNGGSVCYDPVK
eukprot:gene32650-36859_t